eukprot:tig00000248_g21788.t1
MSSEKVQFLVETSTSSFDGPLGSGPLDAGTRDASVVAKGFNCAIDYKNENLFDDRRADLFTVRGDMPSGWVLDELSVPQCQGTGLNDEFEGIVGAPVGPRFITRTECESDSADVVKSRVEVQRPFCQPNWDGTGARVCYGGLRDADVVAKAYSQAQEIRSIPCGRTQLSGFFDKGTASANWDNRITSICVKAGYKVTVFPRADFQEDSGKTKVSITVSSIKVETTAAPARLDEAAAVEEEGERDAGAGAEADDD